MTESKKKNKTLAEKIESIPGDSGWWKSSSEGTYLSIAKSMIAKGFDEDESVELLTDAYYAAANCFGGT